MQICVNCKQGREMRTNLDGYGLKIKDGKLLIVSNDKNKLVEHTAISYCPFCGGELELVEKKIIYVDYEIVDELQNLLYLGEKFDYVELGFKRDEVIQTFTVKFNDNFEVDIKVCSSEYAVFIDPVLFDNSGNQVCVLDTDVDLLGEYSFEYNNKKYLVEILAK